MMAAFSRFQRSLATAPTSPRSRSEFVFHEREALLRRAVALLAERLPLDLEVADAPLQLVDFDRHRTDLQTQRRARFIDQVDRLVRQEAVGDVAIDSTAAAMMAQSLMRTP